MTSTSLSLVAPLKFSDLLHPTAASVSRSEYKRLILTAYLSVICVLVAVIYVVIDVMNTVYYALPAYVVLFIAPFVSLSLLKAGRHKTAKVTLLLAANLVVFWAAAHDPFEAGAFLFFIPAAVGTFSILAFEDLKTGLAITGFTTILFLISYFGDFHPLPSEQPSELYIKVSFLFNYFISVGISVLSIYFLMTLNRFSEEELIQKENFANQKNAELQKVNEALDRFVYSVSHDLRSPLSSILGLINLANLTKDPEELLQIINMIQGRVLAQDNFIREIIEYSRNARTETVAEKIELSKLVDEVIETLKFDGMAEGIEFRKQIPADLTLISDKLRLTVILSNLIGNGIKYHDLKKESPFIEIGYNLDKNAIYVADNGSGVKHEHQQKIFNMFYRGSDRVAGTGLGLFITKEAVAKLGGSIELKSEYGQGSTFTVNLPRKHEVLANAAS